LTSSFRGSTGNYVFDTSANLPPADHRHSRLVQYGRSLHPGHGRDHARPGSQHHGNPDPQLLFFGGGLINQDFDAAGIC